MKINLENLLLLPPVSAGMNPYVVMALTHFYRSTTQDTTPIDVIEIGDLFDQVGDRFTVYRIKDGRHRYFASVMAGRTSILVNIVEE